jgi:hypothetical protein
LVIRQVEADEQRRNCQPAGIEQQADEKRIILEQSGKSFHMGLTCQPKARMRADVIDTRGGFVASTLDITDTEFMAGRDNFSGGGGGRVSNAGRIQTGSGGFVALLGATVRNSGTITVPLGRVGLASGKEVTLDINGDNFLTVTVPADAPEGKVLIKNKGTIEANGGRVEIKAATVATAMREAVHISGAVRANSVSGRNGSIVLGGGPGGHVRVPGGGRLQANTVANRTSTIDITGADISIGGAIDVSGLTPGTITARASRDLEVSGTIAADKSYEEGAGTLSGVINLRGEGATTVTSIALVSATASGDEIPGWPGSFYVRGNSPGGTIEISGGASLVFAGKATILGDDGAALSI